MTLEARILAFLWRARTASIGAQIAGEWISSADIAVQMASEGVWFAGGRTSPILRRLADEGRLERREVPGGLERGYRNRVLYRLPPLPAVADCGARAAQMTSAFSAAVSEAVTDHLQAGRAVPIVQNGVTVAIKPRR